MSKSGSQLQQSAHCMTEGNVHGKVTMCVSVQYNKQSENRQMTNCYWSSAYNVYCFTIVHQSIPQHAKGMWACHKHMCINADVPSVTLLFCCYKLPWAVKRQP